MDVTKHLAVRGLEIYHHAMRPSGLHTRSDEPDQGQKIELSPLGVTVIALGIVVFAALYITINYSIGVVMNNLAMIETPVEGISLESPPAYDDEPDQTVKKDNTPVDDAPSVTLVKPRPLTSNIRATMRHLRATAGRWARLRGLKFGIVHSIAYGIIGSFFALGARSDLRTPPSFSFVRLLVQLFGGVLATIITVPLHMAWTHATIAMPSSKGIRARLPSMKQWRLLLVPAVAVAVTERVQAVIIVGCTGLGGKLHEDASGRDAGFFVVKEILILAGVLIFTLFITLPAEVTLTRIEASMLPEDEDTIVPFDRSFGGKVEPAIVGGTGAIGFWDAWRSFNWEARRRLIKLNVKLWAINMLLAVALITFIFFSFTYLGGAELLVKMHHGAGQQ